MIEFVIGNPKCGKSLYAEGRLASITTSVLYVATLPATDLFEGIIRDHRNRRPSSWEIYETLGNVERDALNIAVRIHRHTGILIDGLSSYVLRILAYYPTESHNLLRNVASLVEMLSESGRIGILLDTPVSCLNWPLQRRVVRGVHRICARRAERLIWYDANPRALDRRALRAVDEGEQIMC
jgi:adenosyl cobinamide kinase/adenosyl cobinamide phosphate guanylyltransferase